MVLVVIQELPWWRRWERNCLLYRRLGFDPWLRRKIPEGNPLSRRNGCPLQFSWASLVNQVKQVKNLPAMRETWVRSLR